MLNLFLLGSCRIHQPIAAAMAAGKCRLINRPDPCWYTHTSSAALQSLDFIMQRVEPPMHMRELVFETNNGRRIDFGSQDLINLADLVIVEVCTLQSIELDGFEVNAHRFRSAKDNGDSRCASAKRSKHTAASIRKDLDEIHRLTGKPLMVVDHISKTGVSKLDEVRMTLTEEIEKAVVGSSFLHFRTAEALDGQDIAKVLRDVNHYDPQFELTIGKMMVELALSSPNFGTVG